MCDVLGRCGYGTHIVRSRSWKEGKYEAGSWLLGPSSASAVRVREMHTFMVVGEDDLNRESLRQSWQFVEKERLVRVPGFRGYGGLGSLGAYSLYALKWYKVVAYVNNVNHTATRSLTRLIQLKRGALRAEIGGGTNQVHAYGSEITLDGSSSYDEDYDPSYYSGVNSGILYQWTCFD
eukprot:gene20521-25083_t